MADVEAPMTGPFGDEAKHLSVEELARGVAPLFDSPLAKSGVAVSLLVSRLEGEERSTPERVLLTEADGMPGDKWMRRLPLDPEAQLTVMRRDVAEIIANGQALTLFGDNLFVDLDLSAANLPIGTRLRLGEAVLLVTPKPHNGCKKFRARFGLPAVELVAQKSTRHLNLRGIYLRVVKDGEVAVGDELVVLDRP